MLHFLVAILVSSFDSVNQVGSLMLSVFAKGVTAGKANTINICHPANLSNMWVPPPLCWTVSQCVLYQDIFELINLTYAGLLHRRYK